jgi:hypothetical protein
VFLNSGSLGIFDRCFSNTNASPRINIGVDVWGESNIMTGVYQLSYFFIPLVIGPLNNLVWWEVPLGVLLGYIALG